MSTARIAVLIITLGAAGVASCLARGSDEKSVPIQPVAPLPTAEIIAAAGMAGGGSQEHAPRRGAGINVVHHGITNQLTAQK